jgi:hypothetical protein
MVGDGFGMSVALEGDVAVVAAPYDYYAWSEFGPYWCGVVYVFERMGSTWVETGLLINPEDNCVDGDVQFARTVRIDSERIFVGREHLSSATIPREVHVFERSRGSWNAAAILSASPDVTPDLLT